MWKMINTENTDDTDFTTSAQERREEEIKSWTKNRLKEHIHDLSNANYTLCRRVEDLEIQRENVSIRVDCVIEILKGRNE